MMTVLVGLVVVLAVASVFAVWSVVEDLRTRRRRYGGRLNTRA